MMDRISYYNFSRAKRVLDVFLSSVIIIVLLPFFILFLPFILLRYPIFFTQIRVGKNNKGFKLYKFRTMKINSHNERNKYLKLNEADGPVFKIKNDPRFTKFGKILSRTGLDELPQVLNVIRGEMSFVGSRPLPQYEFNKLTKKQKIRNSIKPGITSLWVIYGSHNLSFDEWMKLDKKYIEEANLFMDMKIILKTMQIPLKAFISLVLNN